MDVLVRNSSDADVHLESLTNPDDSGTRSVRVEIRYPGGTLFRPLKPLVEFSREISWNGRLDVGGEHVYRVAVMRQASAPRFVTEEPGSYAVRVSLRYRTDPAKRQSQPVTVVSEPTEFEVAAVSESQETALKLWKTGFQRAYEIDFCGTTQEMIEARRRMWGRELPDDSGVAFDTLRAEHGQTPYGRYCWYFWACPWRPRLGPRPMADATWEERRAAIIAVLEELCLHAPEFPLRDEAMLHLGKLYVDEAGLREEGLDLVNHVVREYPQRATAQEARKYLDYLARAAAQ